MQVAQIVHISRVIRSRRRKPGLISRRIAATNVSGVRLASKCERSLLICWMEANVVRCGYRMEVPHMRRITGWR